MASSSLETVNGSDDNGGTGRVIRVMGIDIGIRNFASAVIEFDLARPYMADGISPRFRVIRLASQNILLSALEQVDPKYMDSVLKTPVYTLSQALVDYLVKYESEFSGCDYYVIENQPDKQIKMTCVQAALNTAIYGVYRVPRSRIVNMNSSDKYHVFGNGNHFI